MKYALLIYMLLFNFTSFAEEASLEKITDPKSINYLKYNDSNKEIGENISFAKDLAIGNVNAPITIVEYYSFSCLHCVDFSTEIIPVLKEKYIDTGKVLLILRDFPLDKASLNASMLLKCYASNKYCSDKNACSKRDPLVLNHAILSSRATWENNTALNTINAEAMKNGMSQVEIDSCLKDEVLQDQIVQSKLIGIRHIGIDGVPAIFINGKPYEGKHDATYFIAHLDSLLKEKK